MARCVHQLMTFGCDPRFVAVEGRTGLHIDPVLVRAIMGIVETERHRNAGVLEESLGIGNSLGHRRGNIFLLIVSAVEPAAIEDHEAASKEAAATIRSEEHTSELQSLMRNSYAVFCLKKKNYKNSK